MSEVDKNGGVSNLNLTETPFCPRQIQEGKNCRLTHHDEFLAALKILRISKDESNPVENLFVCSHCGHSIRDASSWATIDEIEEYMAHMESQLKLLEQKISDAKKQKSTKHQSYELGAREFTFTYSPKWMSDNEARIEMIKAMTKILKYYEDEIIELRAVGEVGSNGLSHIHCFYKLRAGLKITDKNFKRAWKYWNPKKLQGNGFEGGHHRNVKCESDFKGYIDKDVDSAWYEVTRKSANE